MIHKHPLIIWLKAEPDNMVKRIYRMVLTVLIKTGFKGLLIMMKYTHKLDKWSKR